MTRPSGASLLCDAEINAERLQQGLALRNHREEGNERGDATPVSSTTRRIVFAFAAPRSFSKLLLHNFVTACKHASRISARLVLGGD